MRFTDKYKAKVQMRAQHNNGLVFASKEKVITVYPLDRDLSQDAILPGETDDGWIVLDGQPVIS